MLGDICGTNRTPRGLGGNSSACSMDMIWEELQMNNIDIDRETLSFHIDTCLREHEGIYWTVINGIDMDNLPMVLFYIYTEMNLNIFTVLMSC